MRRVIIAGVLGLMLVACSGTDNDPGSVDPVETECLDQEAGLAAADLTQSALMGAVKDLKDFDLQGAAQELHNTAGYARDSAEAVEADSAVAVPMARAADLFDSAATKLESVSSIADADIVNSATADIEEAARLIDESTAALENTELEAC